jgi:hypothetical protein
MFPPVPFGLARVVPAKGVTIGDRHFKPGVCTQPTHQTQTHMLIYTTGKAQRQPARHPLQPRLVRRRCVHIQPTPLDGPASQRDRKVLRCGESGAVAVLHYSCTDILFSLVRDTILVKVATLRSSRYTRPRQRFCETLTLSK